MKVKRIITNIDTQDITAAKCFYQDVLGLDLLMDHGWIATYGSREEMSIQISFASQGGSHTPTPDLSRVHLLFYSVNYKKLFLYYDFDVSQQKGSLLIRKAPGYVVEDRG
ncbi:hypothetical protein D1872_227360 [compost metagenome]